ALEQTVETLLRELERDRVGLALRGRSEQVTLALGDGTKRGLLILAIEVHVFAPAPAGRQCGDQAGRGPERGAAGRVPERRRQAKTARWSELEQGHACILAGCGAQHKRSSPVRDRPSRRSEQARARWTNDYDNDVAVIRGNAEAMGVEDVT